MLFSGFFNALFRFFNVVFRCFRFFFCFFFSVVVQVLMMLLILSTSSHQPVSQLHTPWKRSFTPLMSAAEKSSQFLHGFGATDLHISVMEWCTNLQGTLKWIWSQVWSPQKNWWLMTPDLSQWSNDSPKLGFWLRYGRVPLFFYDQKTTCLRSVLDCACTLRPAPRC